MDLDQGNFIFCLLFIYLLLFITFFSFYNNSMLRKNQSIVSMIYEMFLYDNC